LAAALAMCSLNRGPESMITPRILALLVGLTSCPLIVHGVLLLRSAIRVKWMMVVLSALNVIPLRFSYSSVLLMIDSTPARFASAVGPVT